MAKLFDHYPENEATLIWHKDNILFSIVRNSLLGHYCGYVRIPKRPFVEQDYSGFLSYVPVHGGITFASDQDNKGMVYGFDCGHLGDDQNPQTHNIEWLKQECERLLAGLMAAVPYEPNYLLAATNEERAKILDEYHEQMQNMDIEFDLQHNFGAMIKVICGSL